MEKLQRLEKGFKVDILLYLLGETRKNVPNSKTPVHDTVPGYWSKITFIHDRLAVEINRYLKETNILQWKTKRKTALIQKYL